MKTQEYVRLDMDSLRKLAQTAPRDVIEQYADDRLRSYARMAMRDKLEIARLKGRGGWWNEDECSVEYLRDLLREHIDKGDMVDVMNFAAMIYARECAGT